ncbi:hypothetical protein ACFPRL_36645 [Pseudoclavibacter helvolus]
MECRRGGNGLKSFPPFVVRAVLLSRPGRLLWHVWQRLSRTI